MKRPRPPGAVDESCLLRHDGQEAVLALQRGQSVFLHGHFLLTVLRGRVSVVGDFRDSSSQVVELCAPLTRAALQLRVDDSDTEECELLLQHVQSLGGALLTPGLFPSTRTGSAAWLRFANPEREPCEVFPSEWSAVVDELRTFPSNGGAPVVLLVCGRRGVGKSSFVRFAANSLLQCQEIDGVWLVDTDPGQPEVGPPGTVSLARVELPLLSPGFCSDPRQLCFSRLQVNLLFCNFIFSIFKR
jgi:hypothetical protein